MDRMCNLQVVALVDSIVLEEDLAGIDLGVDHRTIAKKSVSP
jgi:hypothetical protein